MTEMDDNLVVLDIEGIALCDEGYIIASQLASDFIETGKNYWALSESLKSITNGNLDKFINMIDRADEGCTSELVLLVALFYNFEGSILSDLRSEDMLDRIEFLIHLLTLENLHRKGLVILNYDDLSIELPFGTLSSRVAVTKIGEEYMRNMEGWNGLNKDGEGWDGN